MIVFKNFLNMSKYDCFLRYYSITRVSARDYTVYEMRLQEVGQ